MSARVAGSIAAVLLGTGMIIASALAPIPVAGMLPTASAASCPNTKLVLDGYSSGAAAADVVVAMNQPRFGYTDPLPSAMDQHVAAVALFGNATQRVVGDVPGPGPGFAGKVIDLCAAGDPICTGGVHDLHWSSHLQPSYISSGLVDQAAGFVAGKL